MKMENILGNTYVIKGHTNIGVYKVNESDVYLIDTGFGYKAGVSLLEFLKENGLNVLGIINTHSHIDHIGGNKLLQEEFNSKVYISDIEKGMVENTLIEPSSLCGAKPNGMMLKFWSAGNSVASSISEVPSEFTIVDLSGHSVGSVGVLTKDGVLFTGDAFIDVRKTKVGYIYDVRGYKESLEKLKSISAKFYVGSHTEVYEDISKVVEENIEAVKKLEEVILKVSDGLIFEEIVAKVFEEYEMEFNLIQYYMVGTTIKSYLSYLTNEEMLSFKEENNKIVYKVL